MTPPAVLRQPAKAHCPREKGFNLADGEFGGTGGDDFWPTGARDAENHRVFRLRLPCRRHSVLRAGLGGKPRRAPAAARQKGRRSGRAAPDLPRRAGHFGAGRRAKEENRGRDRVVPERPRGAGQSAARRQAEDRRFRKQGRRGAKPAGDADRQRGGDPPLARQSARRAWSRFWPPCSGWGASRRQPCWPSRKTLARDPGVDDAWRGAAAIALRRPRPWPIDLQDLVSCGHRSPPSARVSPANWRRGAMSGAARGADRRTPEIHR